MEQHGSASQINKLAENLKRELKTTLSMDNLCPQDPPCAGVRACDSRPVRKRYNCIAHLLFSHTTNRIDVELGARLFRHLVALPIAYFDHAARATVWRACARLMR